MVLRFCKRFLFYSGIMVYTISRIVPESAVMKYAIFSSRSYTIAAQPTRNV